MSYDGRTAETGFNFKTGTTCYTKICILKTTPVTVSVVLCYFNYLRVYVATTDCYVSLFFILRFCFLVFVILLHSVVECPVIHRLISCSCAVSAEVVLANHFPKKILFFSLEIAGSRRGDLLHEARF